MSPTALNELLSSLVASANRFLAPFERVVAFQVLPRALDEAHGELTHKLSSSGEVVEKNWAELIEKMYVQKHLALDGGRDVPAHPELGPARDGRPAARAALDGAAPRRGAVHQGGRRAHRARRATPRRPRLPGRGARSSTSVRSSRGRRCGSATRSWSVHRRRGLPLARRAAAAGGERHPARPAALAGALPRRGRPPRRCGRGRAHHLPQHPRRRRAPPGGAARGAPRRGAPPGRARRRQRARHRLPRPRSAGPPTRPTRRSGAAPSGRSCRTRRRTETIATLRLFLDRLGAIALRDEDLAILGERGLSDAQVEVLLGLALADAALDAVRDPSQRRLLVGTMRLARRPTRRRTRAGTRRCGCRSPACRSTTTRSWPRARARSSTGCAAASPTGSVRTCASPSTRRRGAEYGWKDVIGFEHGIGDRARELLLRAVVDTTLVRASCFLFGRGALLSLADIPPGGATVSQLGTGHGKSVYRLSIHTRARETFDVAINLVSACTRPSCGRKSPGSSPPARRRRWWRPSAAITRSTASSPRSTSRATTWRGRWSGSSATARRSGSSRSGRTSPGPRSRAHVALLGPDRPASSRCASPRPRPSSCRRTTTTPARGSCRSRTARRARSFDELLDRFQGFVPQPRRGAPPRARGRGGRAPCSSRPWSRRWGSPRAPPCSRWRRAGVAARLGHRRPSSSDVRERRLHVAARATSPRRRYARWLEVNPAATVEAQGKMLGELWGTYRLSQVGGRPGPTPASASSG